MSLRNGSSFTIVCVCRCKKKKTKFYSICLNPLKKKTGITLLLLGLNVGNICYSFDLFDIHCYQKYVTCCLSPTDIWDSFLFVTLALLVELKCRRLFWPTSLLSLFRIFSDLRNDLTFESLTLDSSNYFNSTPCLKLFPLSLVSFSRSINLSVTEWINSEKRLMIRWVYIVL